MASNTIDCYVKLPSGRTVTLNLVPSDTIGKICNKISEDEGISADRVNMKYQGKVLKKKDTVGYLGVCKETILKAEITQIKKINVFVRMPSGKTVPVTIENVSPIRYIKDAVHTQENIPTKQQTLKVSGRKLGDNNQRCMDAGITDECVLTLEVTEAKPSPKVAKKMGGKTKKSWKGSRESLGGEMTDEEEAPGESVSSATASNNQETEQNDEELKEALVGTFDAMGKNVEVAFSFDTTGSMYSCLDLVRQKLKETVKRLIEEISNIRIAIIAHGDYCDYNNYVVKYEDFTNDIDKLEKFVKNVKKTGGGDAPECYEWVLRKAQELDWSEESAKALVVIGDDIPHPVSYTDQQINWHHEIDTLKAQGVKIYGVRAQHSSTSIPFYQEISEHTNGAYIEFKNFNIITEMFLAVCYKEAGQEQYEQFCEEMEQNVTEGTVNEEVKDVLKQIEVADTKQEEEKPKRTVNANWWDPTLDKDFPRYSYDAENDKWVPYGQIPKLKSAHSSKTKPAISLGSDESSSSVHSSTKGSDTTSWKSKITRRFSSRKARGPGSRPKSAPPSSSKKGCVVM